ncbi:UDP-3-O-(3-hydroxymyristoyl)glucosamine N-acyltransferase [candidate division WOR-3 bacterium]|nr:UDP-3-O-(3-hydroxymyristoyl)glucosamine N-acyltransferase [candidate division WOR-3 bacterium]
MKLAEISKLINGKLNGDPEFEIKEIARIEEAKEHSLTWFSHPRYRKWLNRTNASCLIVSRGPAHKLCAGQYTPTKGIFTIEVKSPELAIAKLLQKFYPEKLPKRGISELSEISPKTKIGKSVSIGAYTYIDDNSIVEDRVTIFPKVYIGNNVKIGQGTIIYPNATIEDKVTIGKRVIIHSGAVIGSDGFAYVQDKGKHKKIPHRGGVFIGDEVEIGALSTVDRAVIGNTIVGKGTKIDNLVHIAHNVVIGENSILVSQVGIAGSSKLGKNVVVGGMAGISDHLIIGNNVTIAGKSGVSGNIPPHTTVSGYPARIHEKSKKAYGLLIKLPDLLERIRKLERKCKQR